MTNVLLLLVIAFVVQFCSSMKTLDSIAAIPLVYSAVLDADENFHLLWDFDDDKIVFEVQVKTLGYFGLGISPNGGMKNSDIVIGGIHDAMDSTNGVYLTDRYATDYIEPKLDERQDWNIVSGSQNNTHTTVRFWRKLKLCDGEDRDIKSETVRVIWAYHMDDWEAARPKYHGSHRGSKSIFLLNPQKVVPDIPEDSFTIDFIHSNISVPSDDTTYWCEAFLFTPLQNKHHVIKFEPVITPGNEGIVHHIVLYTCSATLSEDTAGKGGRCNGEMPEAARECIVTIFAWAVGGRPFYLPEHVGYPFGLDDDPKLILLQTHFDNPQMKADFMDSSGIRLTFTRTLRQYDAATLTTGVLSWRNLMIPPFAESFRIDGHCMPACTEGGLGNETEINIFATFLHAHLLSKAMKFRHVRNGVEQKPISMDENYDFNLQDTITVEPEVKVKRGDHLVTECFYNTLHKKTVTFGGESTSDEMCVTFAMYYPRVPLRNCFSMMTMEQQALIAGVEIYGFYNRTIREPEHLRGRSLDDILINETDWSNRQTRELAQRISTSYDVPMLQLCDKNGVPAFTTEPDSLKPPRINKEWYDGGSVCMSGVTPLPKGTAVTRSVFTVSAFFISKLLLF